MVGCIAGLDAGALYSVQAQLGRKQMTVTKPHPTPNDQRSNVKNPNNPAHEADRRNRINLGHDDLEADTEARPSSQKPEPRSTQK